MPTTAACPKCSGKKLIVAELRDVQVPSEGPVRAYTIPAIGFNAGLFSEAKTLGSFESWICAACGYTEFYAKDLGDVDELAAQHPADVRIVDSTDQTKGPFR